MDNFKFNFLSWGQLESQVSIRFLPLLVECSVEIYMLVF